MLMQPISPGLRGRRGRGWMGLMIVSWSCDEARDVEYSKLYMNVCVGDMLFHRVPCGLVGWMVGWLEGLGMAGMAGMAGLVRLVRSHVS